jgi:hypothetical protein
MAFPKDESPAAGVWKRLKKTLVPAVQYGDAPGIEQDITHKGPFPGIDPVGSTLIYRPPQTLDELQAAMPQAGPHSGLLDEIYGRDTKQLLKNPYGANTRALMERVDPMTAYGSKSMVTQDENLRRLMADRVDQKQKQKRLSRKSDKLRDPVDPATAYNRAGISNSITDEAEETGALNKDEFGSYKPRMNIEVHTPIEERNRRATEARRTRNAEKGLKPGDEGYIPETIEERRAAREPQRTPEQQRAYEDHVLRARPGGTEAQSIMEQRRLRAQQEAAQRRHEVLMQTDPDYKQNYQNRTGAIQDIQYYVQSGKLSPQDAQRLMQQGESGYGWDWVAGELAKIQDAEAEAPDIKAEIEALDAQYAAEEYESTQEINRLADTLRNAGFEGEGANPAEWSRAKIHAWAADKSRTQKERGMAADLLIALDKARKAKGEYLKKKAGKYGGSGGQEEKSPNAGVYQQSDGSRMYNDGQGNRYRVASTREEVQAIPSGQTFYFEPTRELRVKQ